MTHRLSILFVTLIAALSCDAQESAEFRGDSYGAGIQSAGYIETSTLIDELQETDTVHTTVLATVSEVCQVKGCWMTLVTPDNSNLMVRFKDYGFFVPKDIGGRKVLIEGTAYTTVVPVDDLRHYAEDAGKSKDEIAKIAEPERQMAFMASGVMVLE